MFAEGSIKLPVSLGDEPTRVTKMVNFLVIKQADPYNIILGKSVLHAFQAIPSTYHQFLKYPIASGVEAVEGFWG